LLHDVQQRVGATTAFHHALPRRGKAAKHRLIDRLHFVAQLRERSTAQHPQHAGVGPLAPCAARPEFPLEQTSVGSEPDERRFRCLR
jgi:hypothetical protein